MTSLRTKVLAQCVTTVVYMVTGVAMASPLVYHVGQTDPAMEGWTCINGGTASAFGVNDAGVDALQVVDSYFATGSWLYWNYSMPENTLASDVAWTASARVRVVSSQITTFIAVHDDADYWSIFLTDSGIHLYPGNHLNYLPLIHTIDTQESYKWYQLIYNPDVATDRLGLYIDGVKVRDILHDEVSGFPLTGNYIQFGAASSDTTGTANWAEVSLKLGVHPVPEPASMAILVAGVGMLLKRRYRI